jgi:hypothetical protein
MRGGAVAYPDAFSQELPADMRGAANVAVLDSAFGALPAFAGKYGGMAGGSRRSRRVQFGGIAPVDMQGMLLSPQEEAAAMLNKSWYDENLVNPAFKAPEAHVGGRRRHRASRKANRKSRRAARRAGRKSRRAARRAARK